jgi:SAM-dependent methyltransferase
MASTELPAVVETGSFRDPASRVFHAGGEIYRALSQAGLADYQAVASSGLIDDPRIVHTERVEAVRLPQGLLATDVAAVLRHDRIPFISYPYEWTFSMLKDAALLQLDLLLSALDHDLMLKDSTPYNVQFNGARPVFIDVGAFERLREEELWTGYRQFCMLYLYPLLLQALHAVDFQPWLRGSIDGITPKEMRGLLSFRDRFRRGLTTSVFLHARLDRRDAAHGELKRELGRPGLGKQLILANVRKMRKLVARLEWTPPKSVWLTYGDRNTYTDEDARQKDEFVREVVASRPSRLVWDLGCNNGRHSRIAAESARHVVAIDGDEGIVDLLYRDLRSAVDKGVLALTMNIADPSPALGWRGRERKSLLERGRPDLVLALALVHHVTIGSNVPVKEFVDWLAELGGAVVVEFPAREDPMVQKLLAPKREGLHPDYERGFFERCLHDAFDVPRSQELASGTRTLYFVTPKRSAGNVISPASP